MAPTSYAVTLLPEYKVDGKMIEIWMFSSLDRIDLLMEKSKTFCITDGRNKYLHSFESDIYQLFYIT